MVRPPAFIGREHELATVVDALGIPPALVLIEGEAGIGKTRLVQECLPALERSTVLMAACPPLPEPFPLGPVVDALQRLRDRAAAVEFSPLAGALRPLFPEWAGFLPPAPEALDDPRATRHRVLRALVEVVERLGIEVLVVEDAHWADGTTLEFLLTLTSVGRAATSLVVTYRPTDVAPGSPLTRLTALRSTPPARARVAPKPLDLAETEALVASMLAPQQVAPEFVELLHQHTQGIPLALEESVWLLRDRGDIFADRGRWSRRDVAQLQVPPTVRDSVLERVDRLAPPARQLLEAAAVLAEPVDEPVLAAVAALDTEGTAQGVAGALASGLLREADPFRFAVRHALASRAIEEAIPLPRRRAMHGRAGWALQQLDNPPHARLSRHFRQSGNLPAWRHHAESAADRALASGDDRAAVWSLLELLTVSPPPAGDMARLARKLGEAAAGGVAALAELGGQVAEAMRAALSEHHGSASERGQIRLLLGRLLLQLGEFDEGYGQLQAAVDDLVDTPVMAARAMMSLSFPRGNEWPAGRHLGWLERATNLLPQVSSAADRISLAVDRASALLMLGDPAGWQAAADVGDDAPTLPERRQVARSLMNVGHMAIAWGRYRYARARLQAAEDLMRATGYERLLNSAQLTRAYLDWHTGSWQGLAARVAEVADAVDTLPEAHLEARLILALLDLVGGRRDAAERELREVLAEAARRGLMDTQMAPAAALGRLWLADGAVEDAVNVTRPGIEIITEKGVWLWATDIVPAHVAALVRAGRPAAAQALVTQFDAGLAGREAPAPAAALQECRAALAGSDPRVAADQLAAAAAAWSALPRPYDELLATGRRGQCLLAAGDRDDALALLTTTQQRLWALGARSDADRLAHLLRQHGVEVARTWRGGRRGYGDQLSPRELEVARLVAQGLTNRRVAEALFLSIRTVDRHLSRAMRKLGATSRTGLAVAAAEAGLLDDGPDQLDD